MRTARASGWRRTRSTASRVPAMMPLCGPPSSLSPEKQTSVAPAAIAAAGVGLAGEHRVGLRAGPSRGRPAPAAPWRRADRGERRRVDLLGEADDAVVGGVHAQQQRGLGRDRALVVGGRRAVRRAHLDQAGAARGEDVGDAEAVADLDQLAARDEHVAARGERAQHEHQRGGVVGDGEPGLGAGQRGDQRRDGVLARAAAARREVELEVGVAAGDGVGRGQRLAGERRAAEVGVDDHAGGVHDRPQVRRLAVERLAAAIAAATASRSPPASPSRRRSSSAAAHAGDRHVAPRAGRELTRRRLPEDPVDRRQASEVRHGRSVWFRRARPDLRGRARGGAPLGRSGHERPRPSGAARHSSTPRRSRGGPFSPGLSAQSYISVNLAQRRGHLREGGRTRSGRSRR